MSDQVQIEFTASGCSSTTGNFAPGDLLRCSTAQAKHFVEDAQCAKYAAAPASKKAGSKKPAGTASKTAPDLKGAAK